MGAKLEMKRMFMFSTVRRASVVVLNVSDSEQLGGRQAREVLALASDVGLVGVARFGGCLAERVAMIFDQREEGPEPEDAAEGLRPVADGLLEAATQVTLADVEILAQLADACCRWRSGDDVDGRVDVGIGLAHLVEALEKGGLEDGLLGF